MKYNAIIPILSLVVISVGCKKSDFVEDNVNPDLIYSIKPQEQFLNATIREHNSDFEAYYDYYRRMMRWAQITTDISGNSKNFLNDVGNFNQRYGVFYPQMGATLTDIQEIINLMPDDQKGNYTSIAAIADIPKINYAFYVSDINGSIPYTEAFQARYGGTLLPKYDTQQELYAVWESRLKEVIGILKGSQANQVSLDKYDQYFNGDVTKWIKAANALRLRIAFRLLKRDENTAKGIIADVLGNEADLMSSNADSWVMFADVSFTSGGNWDPTGLRAPKPTLDFMWNNNDPRIRLFYQKNNYSQENIDEGIAAGVLGAGTVEQPRRYLGAVISPDSSEGKYKSWFQTKKVSDQLTLDTVSYLQYRMWQPAYASSTGSAGTGNSFFPVITYAEYCFMRAEAIVKGYATGDAATWYNNGITASIEFYDNAANKAKLEDYTALGATEIADYLNAPDVKYDASKALEQIAVQAFINFYKEPNEAWALYKRTGMPNKNTALANEDIVIDGGVKEVPRRAAITLPLLTDRDYETRNAAIEAMQQDPDFGTSAGDLFGRVWWDKK